MKEFESENFDFTKKLIYFTLVIEVAYLITIGYAGIWYTFPIHCVNIGVLISCILTGGKSTKCVCISRYCASFSLFVSAASNIALMIVYIANRNKLADGLCQSKIGES